MRRRANNLSIIRFELGVSLHKLEHISSYIFKLFHFWGRFWGLPRPAVGVAMLQGSPPAGGSALRFTSVFRPAGVTHFAALGPLRAWFDTDFLVITSFPDSRVPAFCDSDVEGGAMGACTQGLGYRSASWRRSPERNDPKDAVWRTEGIALINIIKGMKEREAIPQYI